MLSKFIETLLLSMNGYIQSSLRRGENIKFLLKKSSCRRASKPGFFGATISLLLIARARARARARFSFLFFLAIKIPSIVLTRTAVPPIVPPATMAAVDLRLDFDRRPLRDFDFLLDLDLRLLDLDFCLLFDLDLDRRPLDLDLRLLLDLDRRLLRRFDRRRDFLIF